MNFFSELMGVAGEVLESEEIIKGGILLNRYNAENFKKLANLYFNKSKQAFNNAGNSNVEDCFSGVGYYSISILVNILNNPFKTTLIAGACLLFSGSSITKAALIPAFLGYTARIAYDSIFNCSPNKLQNKDILDGIYQGFANTNEFYKKQIEDVLSKIPG